MHLSGLFIYPVKSLRGCAAETLEIDHLGLRGDRRFMVVDETGRFLTQRTLPTMALIETALSPAALVLSHSHHGSITVSCLSDASTQPATVSVWSSSGLIAEDCGEDTAAWLSAALGRPCRLVRAGASFHRPINTPPPARPDDVVSFADAYPFLAIGESSLSELNDRLVARGEEPVPMNRFRPNLVFAGTPPFAEDHGSRFRIGNVIFRSAGPCARCIVTTTDQDTAERSPEPLRTLATYRRDPRDSTQINFGQNLVHETKSGSLRLGDRVEIID